MARLLRSAAGNVIPPGGSGHGLASPARIASKARAIAKTPTSSNRRPTICKPDRQTLTVIAAIDRRRRLLRHVESDGEADMRKWIERIAAGRGPLGRKGGHRRGRRQHEVELDRSPRPQPCASPGSGRSRETPRSPEKPAADSAHSRMKGRTSGPPFRRELARCRSAPGRARSGRGRRALPGSGKA